MAHVGWIAAGVAALFHGSFTVPMKGTAANSVNIDPFVFQTFKTFMCFSTCWVVLLLGALGYSSSSFSKCEYFMWFPLFDK